ncbi:MAG: hypothetical protein IJJ00_01160 [Erysipelotrichaceae bacterium]|nr:hypothetical protein [Erysipelotrichaceae bacterium]
MKRNRKKRRIIAILAATIAGIGVLLSGTYTTPEDLINNETADDKTIIEAGSKQVRRSSFLERIPLFIRAIIGVPLWFIGHLILKAVNGLLKITLLPVWKFLITWLLLFLLILLIVVICIKLLFPELTLREILSKKLILTVAFGTLAITVIDLILPRFLENYDKFKYDCIYILGLVLIVLIMFPYIRKRVRTPKIIHEDLEEMY